VCQLGWEMLTCATNGCGVTFSLPQSATSRLRQTNETFYCPHGHTNFFPRKPDAPPVPPAEVRILRQEVEVCRRRNIEAERKASLAERRLNAARTGNAFLEGGRWRGLCPSCFEEQPRGSKKRSLASRWGRMHCATPTPPVLESPGEASA